VAVILEVEGAGFSYDGERDIFAGISFAVEQGEVLAILGSNGTGKSTLIKCVMNLHPLDTGTVRLEDRDLGEMTYREIARCTGYVPQANQVVFPFSVFDFVLMGRSPHLSVFQNPSREDVEITWQVIENIGIAHLAARPISEISGGERQMAMVARALVQQPALLIMDEPTSHLDFGNQIRVLDLIDRLAEQGIAVLMTTHFPDHGFIVSHKVAIIHDGAFISHGYADEVITAENLRIAYGTDVMVKYIEEAGRNICIPMYRCRCRPQR
jgi:iron complex transport system ATP-binding protein